MGGDSGKPVSDLIGDVDPSTVTSITFTSDTVFVIGYNNTEGGWSQPSDQTSYTLTDVLLESYTDDAGDTHDPALCLCLSKGDGVEYTINWTVEADAAAAPSTPADSSVNINVNTALYVGESVTWNTAKSDEASITGAGDYTFSVSDLDIAPSALTVIYVKDVAVENGDADVSDSDPVKITYKSVKINGEEVPVMEGAPDGLNDSGVLDCALYNIWGDSFIALPDANINSVEVTINVAAAEDNAPDESQPEESKPEESKPEESKAEENKPAESDPATSEPSTTEAAGNVGAGTDDKGSPDTGVAGIAAVAGVAVVAAFGVVIAKKRK